MAETPQRGEFADWLREFRKHTQQTQKQLADTLGVHKFTIKQWESGRQYPLWPKRLQLNQWARSVAFRACPPKRYGDGR